MVHGISISPGKPTIVARVGKKVIFGLPGHPVSSMIVSRIFVIPLIEVMSGLKPEFRNLKKTLKARLSRNLASAQGREDYVRVRLERKGDGLWAYPILGKSGLISTLVKADGFVSISMYQEGIEKGEEVEVVLF
jgi:molybdopterin molybdotransferase